MTTPPLLRVVLALLPCTLTLLLGVVIPACVQSSSGGGSGGELDDSDDVDAGGDAEDNTPDGPIMLTLSPSTVDMKRENDSNGSPQSHADLCIGSSSRDPNASSSDPRDNVVLKSGTPCIDNLILRFAVPGRGGDAVLLWSPIFTNTMISAGTPGDERRFTGVPTDGRAVSVSLDTVPNLLTGGDRVRLSFEVSLRPKSEGSVFYEVTIATVTVTAI